MNFDSSGIICYHAVADLHRLNTIIHGLEDTFHSPPLELIVEFKEYVIKSTMTFLIYVYFRDYYSF